MGSAWIRSIPWQDWPGWSGRWAALLTTFPEDSFFLSPAWISAWLKVYGEPLSPELLFVFESADPGAREPIGACLLVRRQRMPGMRMTSVYLNCAGEDDGDSTYIEYNALLVKPGWETHVVEALAGHMNEHGWDRFLIAGAAPQPALRQLGKLLGRVETEVRPCYYVDLAKLRHDGIPYANAISANTRKQNRFTQRSFEEAFGGACVLEEAATAAEADEYFNQLAELHNAGWRARDQPGAFSSKPFLRFHRHLVGTLFEQGQVQLFRLRCGQKTLAVIYTFVYKRRVYFYQSGIFYGEDKRLRPGFLALTMVIEHLRDRTDLDEFDFLAGAAQYKKSLGTGERKLHWTTVWAPSLASGAFRALRGVKGAIVGQVGANAFEKAWTTFGDRVGLESRVIYLYRLDVAEWATSLVESPAEWSFLSPDDIAQLTAVSAPDLGQASVRLDRGDQCYLASVNGRLAHHSWVQTSGTHPITEAGVERSVKPGEFWIYHCHTADWARGNKLYPAALARILNDHFAVGFKTAWIYTQDFNTASQQGIESSQFKRVAILRALRVGRFYLPVRG